MKLDPENDLKIDEYNLDVETSKISYLLGLYDREWSGWVAVSNKLEAQIKNLEDSLKVLRLQLFAEVKRDWANCGFDKAPTDKAAEAYPYEQPEYVEMFNSLKEKRLEYAEAKTNSDLYQNFHYQLLTKEKGIERLFKMWQSGYFIDNREGGPTSNDLTPKRKTEEGTQEMTQALNRRKRNEG